MIKHRIYDCIDIGARNVHVRVIFIKLFIYAYRVALVVIYFNMMFKVRLPLLIVF